MGGRQTNCLGILAFSRSYFLALETEPPSRFEKRRASWLNGVVPFTFAHPAAVVPIHNRWKRWLALAPLAVGSMVPDAGYYLPLPDSFKAVAHTALGTLYSALPVGIVVLLIFYWVAPEVVFLLPSPHREALLRKIEKPTLSLRNASMAVCAIAIGAETHVVWDSFVHQDGWVAERIVFLHKRIWGIPPYLALQVVSSIAGLWIVWYLYDRWAMSQGFRAWSWQESSWRMPLWIAVLAGCVAQALIESHTVQAILSLVFLHRKHFALIFVISLVRNFLLAVCVAAIYIKLFGRRARLDVAY